MSSFNKTVEGTTLRIAPTGSITANNAPQLRDEVNESLEDVSKVIFDFADVDYISSAGLRVILAVQKALAGGEVRVINASDAVREVFEVTKLATFIAID